MTRRRSKIVVLDGKEVKWCAGCKKHLDLPEFGVRRSMSTGLNGRCKWCVKKKAIQRAKKVERLELYKKKRKNINQEFKLIKGSIDV